MERLTERITDKNTKEVLAYRTKCQESISAIQKLGRLEDLEEQGKLLKLPCAVGDAVHCIRESWSGYLIDKKKFKVGMVDKFSKTVFLTRPEAERALAEMEGKNGN